MDLNDVWENLAEEVDFITIVEKIISHKPDGYEYITEEITSTITRTLKSNVLWKINYNPKSKLLKVIFAKNKRKYVYNNVPSNVVEFILAADSKGKAFWNSLRGKYNYKEVT